MAGSSIKLGVDVTEFKRGMTEAQASVKTLDAAIKTNEKSMQAYGKSESYVSTQTNLLNSKLKEQEKIVQNAEKSLKAMEENGVSKSSKAYQDMQRRMIEARGAMLDTTMQLNQLATGEADAAKGAEQLGNSISGISKKISLDQVIGGIDKITGGLENAAKSAIDLGQKLFDVIMDSAAQADDISTMATRLGLTDEQVQQMMYVANRFEAPVETMAKTWKKLKVNMTSDNAEIVAGFEKLGVATHEMITGKYGNVAGPARDYLDVFWEVGEALMNMTDEAAREGLATQLLGRSWDEMIPLFTKGRAAYEAALEAAPTASEDAVENMANLNDRMKELEQSWETLKLQALETIAPALEKGADAIATLLDKITEYLKTDAGQEMLGKLGDAVSVLFDDLSKIDPEKTTQAFVDLFTKVTDGIKWLVDNKETAKGILGAIVTAWGGLELTKGALDVAKLVDGIKGLTATGAAEGAAAGASWGSAFAAAVLKAAPWLLFLYETVKPGTTVDDSMMNENGITPEGKQEFARQAMEDTGYKSFLMELGTYFGSQGLSQLMGNNGAVTDIWNYLIGGKQGYNTLGFINNVLSGYTGGQTFGTDWLGVEFNEEELNTILQGMNTTLTPKIVFPEDQAQQISQEIGVVPVAAELVFHKDRRTGEWIGASPDGENANGIWAVPYDGYLARLHKNERVVPAREVSSRNFSSNLYVESMIMNNGTDAAGLAASMAAAQRRTMAGFGN